MGFPNTEFLFQPFFRIPPVGFTAATEELARSEDGAERISANLNACFAAVLPIIRRRRGDVVSFSGVMIPTVQLVPQAWGISTPRLRGFGLRRLSKPLLLRSSLVYLYCHNFRCAHLLVWHSEDLATLFAPFVKLKNFEKVGAEVALCPFGVGVVKNCPLKPRTRNLTFLFSFFWELCDPPEINEFYFVPFFLKLQ